MLSALDAGKARERTCTTSLAGVNPHKGLGRGSNHVKGIARSSHCLRFTVTIGLVDRLVVALGLPVLPNNIIRGHELVDDEWSNGYL